MMWIKLDKFQVVEKRDNSIYKTKKVGHEWFPYTEKPECYVQHEQGDQRDPVSFFYVETGEVSFGKIKPKN